MLEFYSVSRTRISPRMALPALSTCSVAAIARRVRNRLAPAILAAVLSACATQGPPTREAPLPPTAEPPPPNVNLSGFPLQYRQGYADGCASAKGAERKDATRISADPNYRTGWQDGSALCRKR